MGYNLNFFPNNNFNQPDINNNYNPYMFNHNIYNTGLQQQNTQNMSTQQPYYLFCGNKNDWDEFLLINYNTTEKNIFDDYKLFLQAKQEILEEQDKNKLSNMKNRISNSGNTSIDSTLKSNVKPSEPIVQQPIHANIQQPEVNNIRIADSVNNGGDSEFINRQVGSNKNNTRKQKG